MFIKTICHYFFKYLRYERQVWNWSEVFFSTFWSNPGFFNNGRTTAFLNVAGTYDSVIDLLTSVVIIGSKVLIYMIHISFYFNSGFFPLLFLLFCEVIYMPSTVCLRRCQISNSAVIWESKKQNKKRKKKKEIERKKEDRYNR